MKPSSQQFPFTPNPLCANPNFIPKAQWDFVGGEIYGAPLQFFKDMVRLNLHADLMPEYVGESAPLYAGNKKDFLPDDKHYYVSLFASGARDPRIKPLNEDIERARKEGRSKFRRFSLEYGVLSWNQPFRVHTNYDKTRHIMGDKMTYLYWAGLLSTYRYKGQLQHSRVIAGSVGMDGAVNSLAKIDKSGGAKGIHLEESKWQKQTKILALCADHMGGISHNSYSGKYEKSLAFKLWGYGHSTLKAVNINNHIHARFKENPKESVLLPVTQGVFSDYVSISYKHHIAPAVIRCRNFHMGTLALLEDWGILPNMIIADPTEPNDVQLIYTFKQSVKPEDKEAADKVQAALRLFLSGKKDLDDFRIRNPLSMAWRDSSNLLKSELYQPQALYLAALKLFKEFYGEDYFALKREIARKLEKNQEARHPQQSKQHYLNLSDKDKAFDDLLEIVFSGMPLSIADTANDFGRNWEAPKTPLDVRLNGTFTLPRNLKCAYTNRKNEKKGIFKKTAKPYSTLEHKIRLFFHALIWRSYRNLGLCIGEIKTKLLKVAQSEEFREHFLLLHQEVRPENDYHGFFEEYKTHMKRPFERLSNGLIRESGESLYGEDSEINCEISAPLELDKITAIIEQECEVVWDIFRYQSNVDEYCDEAYHPNNTFKKFNNGVEAKIKQGEENRQLCQEIQSRFPNCFAKGFSVAESRQIEKVLNLDEKRVSYLFKQFIEPERIRNAPNIFAEYPQYFKRRLQALLGHGFYGKGKFDAALFCHPDSDDKQLEQLESLMIPQTSSGKTSGKFAECDNAAMKSLDKYITRYFIIDPKETHRVPCPYHAYYVRHGLPFPAQYSRKYREVPKMYPRMSLYWHFHKYKRKLFALEVLKSYVSLNRAMRSEKIKLPHPKKKVRRGRGKTEMVRAGISRQLRRLRKDCGSRVELLEKYAPIAKRVNETAGNLFVQLLRRNIIPHSSDNAALSYSSMKFDLSYGENVFFHSGEWAKGVSRAFRKNNRISKEKIRFDVWRRTSPSGYGTWAEIIAVEDPDLRETLIRGKKKFSLSDNIREHIEPLRLLGKYGEELDEILSSEYWEDDKLIQDYSDKFEKLESELLDKEEIKEAKRIALQETAAIKKISLMTGYAKADLKRVRFVRSDHHIVLSNFTVIDKINNCHIFETVFRSRLHLMQWVSDRNLLDEKEMMIHSQGVFNAKKQKLLNNGILTPLDHQSLILGEDQRALHFARDVTRSLLWFFYNKDYHTSSPTRYCDYSPP